MTPFIIALDFPDPDAARRVVARLPVGACRLKVGKELFVGGGPAFVRELVDGGWGVFLDLKFHDIPNTVAAACRAAAGLGVWMVNVHALGGSAMLRAAREALGEGPGRPLLTAVTVLTSHDEASLGELGLAGPPCAAVERLAALAVGAGLDGVVCSALEAPGLRARHPAIRLVTPGIRPAGSAADDQRRVMTPAAALAAGADDLVVGRPVTAAAEPATALAALEAGLREA